MKVYKHKLFMTVPAQVNVNYMMPSRVRSAHLVIIFVRDRTYRLMLVSLIIYFLLRYQVFIPFFHKLLPSSFPLILTLIFFANFLS